MAHRLQIGSQQQYQNGIASRPKRRVDRLQPSGYKQSPTCLPPLSLRLGHPKLARLSPAEAKWFSNASQPEQPTLRLPGSNVAYRWHGRGGGRSRR